MNLSYSFPTNIRNWTFLLMAIGIVATIVGFIVDAPHGEDASHAYHAGTTVWANLLTNSFFFFSIALGATFFIAVQYAAEAAWMVTLKRVFEAVSTYLLIGAITLVVVLLAASLHLNHLFHWMVEGIDDPLHENYDAVIAGKTAYLNIPFFWVRTLLFLGVYIWYQRTMRKRSLEEDLVGGINIHFNNVKHSAMFLVFFGFTSVVFSWDWLMSIDTHWFSTLYGWYVFAGMWLSAIVFTTLLTIHLKNRNYLPSVNRSHIHDMGKWVFALSFLWCYLWFSQFMLIWYSNIPEEVTYYETRIDYYKFLFFFTFIINLIFPMLILMARDAKRSPLLLIVVGIIVFIGHWLDVYLLVIPGTVGIHWTGISLWEIGMFLGFLGLFLNRVLTALTKAPLEVQKHPYLEESIHHHI